MYSHHHESAVVLEAPQDRVFAYLDDFHKLSAHMEESSGMMLGARMTIQTDDGGGRRVGSKVRMAGRVLGIPLALVEIITLREPPFRKAWQTVEANLAVIGRYSLGFELAPEDAKTKVRVYIDYDLPAGVMWIFGKLLGKAYARWCTTKMVDDAARQFAK